MVPAPQPSSSQPFPPDLKSHHPNPQTPWNFSEVLFKRVQAYTSDKSFKLCEILNTDPELNFILKYFEHQKPPGYSIKRVVCIHNPDQTTFFEAGLKNMERESNNPVFAPKGKDEEPKPDRARVLVRWESQASQFSPVEIKSLSSRGTDTCTKVKVLPLWHGSTKEVCQSVCWSGFTSFGKHHYFDENASKGNTKSTDKGYFGAGIYFTNSAQYATMYSSGGHLLLVWVSMREPYPVVNDKPHPQKGSDMLKLEGRMHYQNYNAHFIPVASIRPQDPKCLEYYPCYKDQQPAWDEFVVFEKAQALPRFWVELGTDFPKVVLSDLGTAEELLKLLLSLLNKPEVQQHPDLAQKLQAKVDLMRDQAGITPLGVEDQKFLKLAKSLLPEGEKLNTATVNMLIRSDSLAPKRRGVRQAIVIKHPSKAEVPAAIAHLPDVYTFLQEPQLASSANPSSSQAIVPQNRYDCVNLALQPSESNPPSHSAIFDELEQMSKPSKIYTKPLPKPSRLELSSNLAFAPEAAKTASFSPVIPFGKELWAKYLGDVGEEPPLPPDIEKILESPCPFFPGRRVEETHLLTLIPKTVNGKLLTLNYLEELVKHPKQDQATQYRYYNYDIEKEYGSQPPQRSYWVLMTRDVIPESRNKNYEAQKQLVASYSQKARVPYEIPHLLEATASIFMEYLKTGLRLYSNNPLTCTRCQERVYSHPAWPLVVGGFAAGGLAISHESNVVCEFFGVGGLWKFNDQGITQDSKETATSNIPLEMKSILHSTHPVNPPPAAASAKISSSSLPLASLSPVLPKLSFTSILPAIAFGKELWAKYLGDVGEEPPLPADIDKILKSPCPFFNGKRVEETHLLTLIPKTVNGMPLTLNALEELVRHPKRGPPTKYQSCFFEIRKEYGKMPLQNSYWALMTKGVIPGSLNKEYDEQSKLLKKLSQKAKLAYEVPHLLEAATCIFMEYLRTGKQVYSHEYTRCQERVSADPIWPLIVGDFSKEYGLHVNNGSLVSERSGLGGLRKL